MRRGKITTLVEGVDYYMEGQRFVFTAAYHRKRGYCCNSRCRHCPFRGEAAPVMKVEVLAAPGKPPASDG